MQAARSLVMYPDSIVSMQTCSSFSAKSTSFWLPANEETSISDVYRELAWKTSMKDQHKRPKNIHSSSWRPGKLKPNTAKIRKREARFKTQPDDKAPSGHPQFSCLREVELNYSKTPHIRIYSYGLSFLRLLLAIYSLAKCWIGRWNETVLTDLFYNCVFFIHNIGSTYHLGFLCEPAPLSTHKSMLSKEILVLDEEINSEKII